MLLFKNNEKWVNPEYDKKEEIMASVSHGFGLALSIVGFIGLIYLGVTRGDIWQLVSFIIYGLSLITLYLASTLYHGVQKPRVKRKLRVFDHIGIYLLIAGTYTPFMLIGMENGMSKALGWGMLAVIWSMALFGIVWKIFFLGKFEILAVIGYIVMGTAGVVLLRDMLAAVPVETVIWLGIGGAIYILGVIFYAIPKIPYNHVIWHLFVMSASLAHFVAVLTLLR
jgi:hemolysin III